LAEWDAEFRNDISAFLDDQTIEQAVEYGRPLELPPVRGRFYKCFVDPSGGRADAYTIAIGIAKDKARVSAMLSMRCVASTHPLEPCRLIRNGPRRSLQSCASRMACPRS
jgi:hypothetical protein